MTNASAASYAYGTAIRMVAYARHDDACRFVCQMTEYVWPLLGNVSWPAIVTTAIAKTKEQFIGELQAPAALTLVSVHGPGLNDPATPFSSRIGDTTPENQIELRKLNGHSFTGFGARAGMIWDACHAGREAFRAEFARLSHPGVVHVGPLGQIEYEHSERIATTILRWLLAPGSQPITPAGVSVAAERAAASVGIDVWYGAP